MTERSHPRTRSVLAAVIAAPRSERVAILDRECAGDTALRQEVLELLAGDAAVRTAPDTLAVGAMDSDAERAGSGRHVAGSYEPGTVVGNYTIVGPLGSGGHGVVYLARQSPPEERLVALKVLEGLPVSWRESRRFEEERRLLARLDHHGVAKIYSGGTTHRGHPYFAMEFLAGDEDGKPAPNITAYAAAHRLSVRQRVELFHDICLALQHAHQKGIVHRDLKPSNILVARADGRARPKIIDFGIARLIDEGGDQGPGPDRTLLTLQGELLGTPCYMSPEQVARQPVDTRTDVYSLGVVLYELLCGAPPFPYDSRSGPFDTHLRAIREEPPLRPSRAVLANSAGRSPAAAGFRQHARLLRGDLDTVLLKALEKQPERRYSSAGAFAEDLRKHLANQPIDARVSTGWYTLTRFGRRHRAFVVAATAVLASLIAATTVSMRQTAKARFAAAVANVRAAQNALRDDDGAALGRFLDDVPPDLRGWEWRHLYGRADRSIRRLDGHATSVAALAISPDGRILLSGGRDGIIMKWHGDTGLNERVATFAGRYGERDTWSLAWDASGDRFASGTFDGWVRLWPAAGDPIREINVLDDKHRSQTVYAVAFSRTGPLLAMGGGTPNPEWRPFVALHDARTGDKLWSDDEQHALSVTDLAFSPDGRWLATASDDRTVVLWSLDGAAPACAGRVTADAEVNAVAISPDGTLLAAGTMSDAIELYAFPSLQHLKRLEGHTAALASLAFAPDGRILASASWDHTVRLWEMPAGSDLAVLRGHRGRVNRVAFANDGRLFSASDDATVREWNAAVGPEVPVRTSRLKPVDWMTFLADGRLAIASTGLAIVGEPSPLDDQVAFVAVSPGAETLAWIRKGKTLKTWSAAAGVEVVSPDLPFECSGLFLDDRGFVVAGRDGLMRRGFDDDEWRPVGLFRDPDAGVPLADRHFVHALHTADGRNPTTLWTDAFGIVFESGGRSMRLADNVPLRSTPSTTGGRVVLRDRMDRILVVYDTVTGRQLATLVGHRERVLGAAFSPDESRLASVGNDDMLRIWDWRREEEVLSLPHPASKATREPRSGPRFSAIAWSRDGKTIATGSSDGTIHYFLGQ